MSEDPGTPAARTPASPRWLPQPLVQRRIRQIGPIVICILVVSDFSRSASPSQPHRVAALIALAVFLAGGLVGLSTSQQYGVPRRGQPRPVTAPGLLHVTGLLALAAASVALCFLQTGPIGNFGLFFALVAAIPLLPLEAGAVLALAGAVVTGVSQGLHHTSVVAAGLAGLAFSGGYLVSLLSRRVREGAEQNARMQHQAAALAERQRLARDMHDVLAHSLSGLMLQLEGARLLAQQDPADPRLPETIERAHHLAKTGLAEARQAIAMLRDDDLPGPGQLPALAEQFQRDSGISCQLTVTGAARPLDSQAQLALYRVAQEALTNVRKHARTDRVDIQLAYADGRTSLTVEDFAAAGADGSAAGADSADRPGGPGPASPVAGTGGGYGLTGMRERAELLGGSLRAGPTAAGFRVELEVPA